jgi:hypothetical protein
MAIRARRSRRKMVKRMEVRDLHSQAKPRAKRELEVT